ncbi:MAG: hypothetical protein CMO13_02140 [Thaumarchaeota archaeon]|nr:hypothetical protein [Nitrososphaerota archaeon]
MNNVNNRLVKLIETNTNNYTSVIIGCKSSNSSCKYCEYNIITIGTNRQSKIIIDDKIGFVNIDYISYKELINSNKNYSYKLLNCKVLEDDILGISKYIIDLQKNKNKIIKNQIHSTLINLTSEIQKSSKAINKSLFLDADYWIMSASYKLINLIILLNGKVVYPSHLLEQLKNSQINYNIDNCYSLLNLEMSTKSATKRRLEVINKLYLSFSDLLKIDSEHLNLQMELLEKKIEYLTNNQMIANAYCLIGNEINILVNKIYKNYCLFNNMTPHDYKILSEIIDINGKNRVSKSIMNMIPLTNNESTITTKLIMLKKLTNTIRNQVKY